MLRIPLGTYDLEEAHRIRNKFNEQRNKNKERSEERLRSHILFRNRGNRMLYKKNKDGTFEQICSWSGQREITRKYAQRVALYLIINERN